MSSRTQMVHALFNPKSIAIVGASPTQTAIGSWSFQAYTNLRNAGYAGKIYPINPRYPEIWDQQCFPDVASLPEVPDQLLLVLPVDRALPILDASAKAGTRSAVLYAAGFSEALNEAGASRVQTLRSILDETEIALCGPNCMGYASLPTNSVTIPGLLSEPRGDTGGTIAIMAQSGGVTSKLYRSFVNLGVLPRFVVSSGNEMSLTTEDFLEYFLEDRGVDASMFFIESLKDPERFLRLCEQAAEKEKPVVVVKVGVSEQAQVSVIAHTGRMAGSGRVFTDVARDYGVVCARTIDEGIDVLGLYRPRFLPKSRRLGAVTGSGGMRTTLLDSASHWEMEFPPLSEETSAELAESIEVGMALGNPVDIGQHGRLAVASVQTLADDDNTDTVLLHITGSLQNSNRPSILPDLQATADETGKLIVLTSYELTGTDRSYLEGVAYCASPDRTVAGLRKLADYRQWLTDHRSAKRLEHAHLEDDSRDSASPQGSPIVRRHTDRGHLDGASNILDEDEAKQLLEDYGLRTPRRVFVDSPVDAVAASDSIGRPVILKVVSDAVPHKSALGLVSPLLFHPDEVEREFRRLEARCGDVLPPGTRAELLLEEAIVGGLECAIGISRDLDFGLVMMFGTGGAQLEIYNDLAFALPVDNAQAAERLIRRTKIGQILLESSFGTRRRYDVQSLVDTLITVGNIARDGSGILQAIDLNPVMVRDEGQGTVALDASVIFRTGE